MKNLTILRTHNDIDEHICEILCNPIENSLGWVSDDADYIEIGDIGVVQSKSLLYQHSTGAVVWNVTPKLADWIGKSPLADLIRDKTVVELGSGTGALALMLHKIVQKYIATDQRPLLKLLRRNCASLPNVEIAEFDWELQEFEGTSGEGAIVACDTIYNYHLIKPLAAAIQSVWRSSPGIHYAILAVQVRDVQVLEDALKMFMDTFGDIESHEISPGFLAFVVKRSLSQDAI